MAPKSPPLSDLRRAPARQTCNLQPPKGGLQRPSPSSPGVPASLQSCNLSSGKGVACLTSHQRGASLGGLRPSPEFRPSCDKGAPKTPSPPPQPATSTPLTLFPALAFSLSRSHTHSLALSNIKINKKTITQVCLFFDLKAIRPPPPNPPFL